LGADIFICDKLDQLIDFNSTEGDKKVGKCWVFDKSLSDIPCLLFLVITNSSRLR
jgi:hypothetical protein